MPEPAAIKRRVVITGMGAISPLGQTLDQLWQALREGRSGVTPVEPPGVLPVAFAGQAHEFTGDISNFGPVEGERKKAIRKGLKLMCRESQMGVAAAQRAISHARPEGGEYDPERSGVAFGSDYMLTLPDDFVLGVRRCRDARGEFDFSLWPTQGLAQVTPLWLLKYLPNMPASHIAIYNDLRGPNNSLTLREAAGHQAIGEALQVVRRGHAEMMVAGATGTRVHPTKSIHVALQEELADQGSAPAEASRPFDAGRTGMVMGEGAGVVVLESLESAQARGAVIHAEVMGAGTSIVADRRLTANRTQALVNAMHAALRDAGMRPEQIGHVQAHGLGTRSCDADEAAAIARVFSDRSKPVPVVAAKSYFGNLGAGSGAVELIAGVLAIQDGQLFPVLNYRTPDAACPISVVADRATDSGESFVSLSVTPQGQAACVAVRRFAE